MNSDKEFDKQTQQDKSGTYEADAYSRYEIMNEMKFIAVLALGGAPFLKWCQENPAPKNHTYVLVDDMKGAKDLMPIVDIKFENSWSMITDRVAVLETVTTKLI